MGESQQRGTTSSRTRNTIGGRGEIVEVQGGHIVRSTGRKDRHSKVCTAKGPRDRRVRLSANTAIQFYDVQDRLGYDRPSKAVDWLIKKAKAAIDELEELPAWNPTSDAAATATPTTTAGKTSSELGQRGDERDYQLAFENLDAAGGSSSGDTTMAAAATTTMPHQQHLSQNPNSSSSFLPPALDSDAIADTIKSFLPMGATAGTTVSSPSIQFQNYPPDLLSRTSSQSQDLRLSLQLFQEPILLQHHHQRHHHGHAQNEQQAALLSETTAHHGHFGFDGSSSSSTGWSEQHPADISRYQRMVAWNAGDTGSASGGGGGFIFNTVPPSPPQPLFGQNQLFTQRGTLQSSNMPSIRAWIDPAVMTSEHHIYHQQSTLSASAFGGFTGFRVPARIQGEEEEHDGIHNRPSSAYSESRH